MKIGIIGIGHLGYALAEGYAKAGLAENLIISPRGRTYSARLHGAHDIEVAPDNETVVRSSDAVIIATRPGDVVPTIRMLPWREGQAAICVAAGITAGQLRGAVIPADVARAMPVLASALNESAIPLFPDLPLAIEALSPLGRVTPLASEDAFSAASSLGAWFGWMFELAGATADTLILNGVETGAARQLSADMMRAAGALIGETPERDPRDALAQLATPGGITEVGLKKLREEDAMGPWNEALAAAMKRLQELGASGG